MDAILLQATMPFFYFDNKQQIYRIKQPSLPNINSFTNNFESVIFVRKFFSFKEISRAFRSLEFVFLNFFIDTIDISIDRQGVKTY